MNSTGQLLLTKSSTHRIKMEVLCVKSKSLGGICRRWCVPRDPSNTAPRLSIWPATNAQPTYLWVSASVTTVEVPSWSSASQNSQEFPYTRSGLYAINWHGRPIVTCQDSEETERGSRWLRWQEADGPAGRVKYSPEDSGWRALIRKGQSSSVERA